MMNRTQFNLKKVKTLKGGGLEVSFVIHDQVGASQYEDIKNVKSTKFISPDLEMAIMKFKPHFSTNLGYDHIRILVNEPDFKATKKQVEQAENQYQFMFEKLRVNGVSIANDGKSIKILGVNDLNGQVIAINTTQLRFDTSKGYEEDLQKLLEDLTEEVYLFLFENKVSNPELGLDGENDQEA